MYYVHVHVHVCARVELNVHESNLYLSCSESHQIQPNQLHASPTHVIVHTHVNKLPRTNNMCKTLYMYCTCTKTCM